MKDITISLSSTIIDALKKLDKTAEKVLLVVDELNRLLGTITDGDIRRYILKVGKIDGFVQDCYYKYPTFVYEDEYNIEKIKKLMVDKSIEVIPILNRSNQVVEYIKWKDIFGKPKEIAVEKMDIPVVIMAGGRGTRLYPFTKVLPKPLIPLGDKPIIEHIIDNFLSFGIKKFYITLNYKADMIQAYFNGIEKDYDIEFIKEEDFLGTAGSLYYLRDIIKTDFIVSNCDIILNVDYRDVYNFHKERNSIFTSLTSIQHYKIPYGVIEILKGGKIKQIKEKPEYTFQINTGVYLLSNEIFNYLKEKKYQDMPYIISVLMADNKPVYAYPVNENDYIDIGQWEEYKESMKKFKDIIDV